MEWRNDGMAEWRNGGLPCCMKQKSHKSGSTV